MNAMIAGCCRVSATSAFTDRHFEDLLPEGTRRGLRHEVGHAKHGHIWLYSAFLTLSFWYLRRSVCSSRTKLITRHSLLTVNAAGVRGGFATGWKPTPRGSICRRLCCSRVTCSWCSGRCRGVVNVRRTCSVAAVSCEDPNCTGHDEATVFPVGARTVCVRRESAPLRVALARVGDLNGISMTPERALDAALDDWRDGRGFVPGRLTDAAVVAYLLSLIDNPARNARFSGGYSSSVPLMLTLVAALVALGQSVGWGEFTCGNVRQTATARGASEGLSPPFTLGVRRLRSRRTQLD